MSDCFNINNMACEGLLGITNSSVDALVTDPPYGISYQGNYWDKDLPNPQIWQDCLRVVKPGAYGLVFSSIHLQHRMTVAIEDAGFVIKDVLMWAYLNGMPKSRDVSLDIDKLQGVDSKIIGHYKYVQGYRKESEGNYYAEDKKPILEPVSEIAKNYKGFGLGVKPAYEPIILIQKPVENGLSAAANIIKNGVGALNLEDTRLPYALNEAKVGHNPHPKGRVCPNILRTDSLNDGYDKFFLVPKVRQSKDSFNSHPTLKPVELMLHLVKLVSTEHQIILDPFMGSGSTGVAALELNRQFIGFERELNYFNIAMQRLNNVSVLKKQVEFSLF